MSGILSTVAVTSLKAYIFLSAKTMSLLCDMIENLFFNNIFLKSSNSNSVLNPGMLSNLSIVPPVCPNPLPDILGTYTPQEATIGPIIKLVLSPTPPVLCLSTVTPSIKSNFIL